jgi:hypothetical protein
VFPIQIKKPDAFFSIFLSFLIDHCYFKVNLFICLDNIFPCSLINLLIEHMFLIQQNSGKTIVAEKLTK